MSGAAARTGNGKKKMIIIYRKIIRKWGVYKDSGEHMKEKQKIMAYRNYQYEEFRRYYLYGLIVVRLFKIRKLNTE